MSPTCTVCTPFCFLQAKATVLLATGAIPPHLGEFLAEHQCQLRAVEPQQVIHVAAAGWPASITVKAGTGEIGAARNHCCLIDHQKFVVHQAAAAAPVFGVVNQWNLRGLKERHGISVEGFFRTRAAIPIAVGQRFN